MFEMKKLDFGMGELEPYISAKTLDFHYNKHYKGYVDKLNELISGGEYAYMSLEDIVKESFKHAEHKAIYNNAGQVWNHEFFWKSLTNKGPLMPKDDILQKINQSFGSYANFKVVFKTKALAQFGSGWCWVVAKDNKIDIATTSNADNPISLDLGEPLLCVDVWEHAYYLDYQNRRVDFVDAFLEHLIRW